MIRYREDTRNINLGHMRMSSAHHLLCQEDVLTYAAM